MNLEKYLVDRNKFLGNSGLDRNKVIRFERCSGTPAAQGGKC